MKKHPDFWRKTKGAIVFALCLAICSCGSEGDSQTTGAGDSGTTLQGNILSVSDDSFQIEAVESITVSVGESSATTDAQGDFLIENIPTGDQIVQFSVPTGAQILQSPEQDVTAEYHLKSVKMYETIILGDIEINGSEVSTEHTGTWTGTAGSSDPSSEGQIAFTMTIEKNGNEISGEGILIGSPDQTKWIVDGRETGITISGDFLFVPKEEGEGEDSPCAGDASFSGTFSGNTVSGTFTETNPPEGCGPPESGTFTLVKE